jgi:hypothetical protein
LGVVVADHRINLTERQWTLLKGLAEEALRCTETDARDGFAYMDDVRDDNQYVDGISVGLYGDPYFDETQPERQAAFLFRARCEVYYRIFHEDWAGRDSVYTQEGKWQEPYFPPTRHRRT